MKPCIEKSGNLKLFSDQKNPNFGFYFEKKNHWIHDPKKIPCFSRVPNFTLIFYFILKDWSFFNMLTMNRLTKSWTLFAEPNLTMGPQVESSLKWIPSFRSTCLLLWAISCKWSNRVLFFSYSTIAKQTITRFIYLLNNPNPPALPLLDHYVILTLLVMLYLSSWCCITIAPSIKSCNIRYETTK